jgi:hypothetical protein
VVSLVLLLLAFAGLVAHFSGGLLFHPYWVVIVFTTGAGFWLLGERATSLLNIERVWAMVLLAELWALAWPLVAVRPQERIYASGVGVNYLAEHRQNHGRVLDRDAGGVISQTPLGFALPMLNQIETVRGFNPLDVYRFKEYLQLIKDSDRPVVPNEAIPNFPIRNQKLVDLLGVRYLMTPTDARLQTLNEPPMSANPRWRKVLEDPSPTAYVFTSGGRRRFPGYTIYENRDIFPRAFVVPQAVPLLPRAQVREQLKNTDLRRQVLLEGFEGHSQEPSSGMDSRLAKATISEYFPNRVVVEVEGATPGYLVLTDVWYPGWTCAVDGRPARLYRADFLFRAVEIPAGSHQVEFRFVPDSYRRGWVISVSALGVLLVFSLAALAMRWLRRQRRSRGPP